MIIIKYNCQIKFISLFYLFKKKIKSQFNIINYYIILVIYYSFLKIIKYKN